MKSNYDFIERSKVENFFTLVYIIPVIILSLTPTDYNCTFISSLNVHYFG